MSDPAAHLDDDDDDDLTGPPVPGESTSYRIIEYVRKRISNAYVTASDTDVAKAIGVSRAAVSAYKAGRDVMSQDRFMDIHRRFLHLAEDHVLEILAELSADAALDKDLRQAWGRIRDRVGKKKAGKSAASIVLAGMLVLGGAQRVEAAGEIRTSSAASQLPTIYIMRNSMRRGGRRERRRRRTLPRVPRVA